MKRTMRSRASTFLLLFGLVTGAGVVATQMATGCFDVESDCANSLDRDGCQGALALNVVASSSTSSSTGSTGTSMSSSSTGSTSSSSSGTGGGMPACSASNCSVPAGTCYPYGTAACDAGQCDVAYMPAQIPYGTCQTNVCEPNGNIGWTANDTNTYNDGTGCNSYPCDGGMDNLDMPVQAAAGTSCVLPSGLTGYCEANPDPTTRPLFICAQCDPNTPSSCPSTRVCSSGKCVPVGCTTGGTSDQETDTDCGGPNCLQCRTGKKCAFNSDCFSQVCTDAGVCAGPTCTDGEKNAQETAQDCGGPVCPPCADHSTCLQPSDCMSQVCLPSTTPGLPNQCAPASCTDGVKNGSETGIDCGGSCPSPCGPDGG